MFAYPRFGLTAIYLLTIQYFTRMGGKISMKLIKYENYENAEHRANSLVYKVGRKKASHSLIVLNQSELNVAFPRCLAFTSCSHILECFIMLCCIVTS